MAGVPSYARMLELLMPETLVVPFLATSVGGKDETGLIDLFLGERWLHML
jgi:hypothetical protein